MTMGAMTGEGGLATSSTSTTEVIRMLNDQAFLEIPMHLEDIPLDAAAEALTIDVGRVQVGGKFLVERMLALSTLQQQLQLQLRHLRQAVEDTDNRASTILAPSSPRDRPVVAPPGQRADVGPSAPIVDTSGHAPPLPVETTPPTPDQDTRLSSPENSAAKRNDVLDLRIPEPELPSRQASSAGPLSESSTTPRFVDEIDSSQRSDQSGSNAPVSLGGSSLASQPVAAVAGGESAPVNRDLSDTEIEDARAARQEELDAATDRVRAMEVRVPTAANYVVPQSAIHRSDQHAENRITSNA